MVQVPTSTAVSMRCGRAAAEAAYSVGLLRRLRAALSSGRLFVVLLLAITGILIVLPIGVLGIGSFLSQPPQALQFDFSGITLGNYVAVLTDPGFFTMVVRTVSASLVGTFGAVLIGVSLAWLAVRTNVPGRPVLNAIAIMPMFVPPLIGAFSWDILASPQSGVLNLLLHAAGIPLRLTSYSVGGIAFVFSIYYAPYIYLLVAGALRNMDAVLEEAAALSGAGRFRTARDITLPLVLPALLSSSLVVFVLLMQVFAIPEVLGEPANIEFVSQRIWGMVGFAPPHINGASALGMMLLIVTVILVLLQQRILARRSYVTVAGKGLRPKLVALGGARWPLAILAYLYLLLVVLLPYLALMFMALRRNLFFSTVAQMLNPTQFNLSHFDQVLTDPLVQLSLWNSLKVAVGVVAIGCTLHFSIAYVGNRTRLPGRRLLSTVAVMPIAIPGIILGLGYMWCWVSLPAGISGTLWVIILSYVAQFTPLGVYAISSALVQIHPELEESSRLCGARIGTTLRRIVVPLAWPGMLSAMILLAVISFRELDVPLFLYTTDTIVFSLAMFNDWIRGSTGGVAVMALIQSAVLLAVVVLAHIVRRNRNQTAL